MNDDLDDSATILTLPVKPRDNNTERVLTLVPGYKCIHKKFLVDEQLEQVECAECHERLNPMWVLGQLCRKENRYHELHARYQDELQRLGTRSRTKCRHCGQMTAISGR